MREKCECVREQKRVEEGEGCENKKGRREGGLETGGRWGQGCARSAVDSSE